MKIVTLTQNITDTDTFTKGLALAKQWTASIGLDLEFVVYETTKHFTSIPFSNETNANGYIVTPGEIFQEAKTKDPVFDIALLVFDASKLIPAPTNPADNGEDMQISIQWYATFPEVLAQYILHELCHYEATLHAVVQDMTHLMLHRDWNPALYDQFAIKPLQAYYVYLLGTFKPSYTLPQAPVTNVTHPTLRIGSKGADVVILQQKLGIVADGKFGPNTQKALIAFQSSHGLTPDGVCGPKSWSVLLVTPTPKSITDIIIEVCLTNGVEPELGIAVATCESGLNPRATLYNPPSQSTDRGLYQINSVYHSEVTDQSAFDPAIATKYFCDAVKAGKLIAYWSASKKCWSSKLSATIKQKYGII